MTAIATQIRARLAEGRRADAIDMVYDKADDLLLAGHFDEADALLRSLAADDLPSCVLMSALTVSRPYRGSMPEAWEVVDSALRARGHVMFPGEVA